MIHSSIGATGSHNAAESLWGRPPDEWARQSVVWASSLNHGSEPDALRSIDPPRLNDEPAGFATSLPASPLPIRLAGGSAARWLGELASARAGRSRPGSDRVQPPDTSTVPAGDFSHPARIPPPARSA
jgi:hypothetical protein